MSAVAATRNPVHVNLAMQCIANIGSKDMAEAFGQEIPRLLVSADAIDVVKQSAALCLLRLFRTSPEVGGGVAQASLAAWLVWQTLCMGEGGGG